MPVSNAESDSMKKLYPAFVVLATLYFAVEEINFLATGLAWLIDAARGKGRT